jgi:hypothetical protein
MSRIPFQTLMRAAAVAFLTDYAASTMPPIKLQVYPARPRSLFPPTGFVDSLSERIEYTALNQRQPTADVIVVHGLFDSKEAATQRDAFVDGFIDWSLDRIHQAHGNTTVAVTDVDDLPSYVPDWMPPAEQKTYYATRITLEGLALTG